MIMGLPNAKLRKSIKSLFTENHDVRQIMSEIRSKSLSEEGGQMAGLLSECTRKTNQEKAKLE